VADPVTVICSRVNFITFKKPLDRITLETIVAAAMQIPKTIICEFFKKFPPSISASLFYLLQNS
jgi:hypothetical protein